MTDTQQIHRWMKYYTRLRGVVYRKEITLRDIRDTTTPVDKSVGVGKKLFSIINLTVHIRWTIRSGAITICFQRIFPTSELIDAKTSTNRSTGSRPSGFKCVFEFQDACTNIRTVVVTLFVSRNIDMQPAHAMQRRAFIYLKVVRCNFGSFYFLSVFVWVVKYCCCCCGCLFVRKHKHARRTQLTVSTLFLLQLLQCLLYI